MSVEALNELVTNIMRGGFSERIYHVYMFESDYKRDSMAESIDRATWESCYQMTQSHLLGVWTIK